MGDYPTLPAGSGGAYCDPNRTWDRPCDWLDLPTITASDDKIAMLVGVLDKPDLTYIAFKITTDTGTVEVDWGDGNSETLTSGTVMSHAYDVADLAGTQTSLGLYQAVCVVTPTVGVFSDVEFAVVPPGWVGMFSSPQLELKVSAGSSDWTYAASTDSPGALRSVSSVSIVAIDPPTGQANLMFRGFRTLEHVELDCTNMHVAQEFLDWDTKPTIVNLTNYGGLAYWQAAFLYVNSTILDFPNSTSLVSAPSLVQLAQRLRFCRFDFSSVTDPNAISSAFLDTPSLEDLILTGLKVSIDLTNCALQHNALEAFYGACGDPVTPQTITVVGNPGALTADDSGLHPNWTVVKT